MEDVANYADRLFVMNHGELVMSHPTKEVFARYKELESMQLAAPQVTYVMNALKDNGFKVPTDVTTVAEAKQEILKLFDR
jgi:energy-coupling factor transport system ATP-binding protein